MTKRHLGSRQLTWVQIPCPGLAQRGVVSLGSVVEDFGQVDFTRR